jgi:hypothetical protein
MSKDYIITTKHIEITWIVSGYNDYCFGIDKKLYNKKTGKEIIMTLNGSTKGFWISKKFLSLNKIRPLLKRPINYKMPF